MLDACGVQLDANNNVYQEDLYFWFPAVKRTLSLVRGYRTLMESGNYYAALPLIRLVLDSGLRFASLWFVGDRRAFFEHINNGGEIRSYKDDRDKKLTDAQLLNRISEFWPSSNEDPTPVKTLYKELCSFIHLNDRHISTLKDLKQDSNPGTRVRPFSLGADGDILTDEEKFYAATYLYGALTVVQSSCKSWEQERANLLNTSALS